jgi:hypothetical protein
VFLSPELSLVVIVTATLIKMKVAAELKKFLFASLEKELPDQTETRKSLLSGTGHLTETLVETTIAL